MNLKKEKLLQKAYNDYLQLMLYDFPVKRIKEIVVDDISGYGTTVDEKVLEIARLKKIVTDQREQGAGIEMEIKQMPVHRRISPEDDVAIFMDEFEVAMLMEGNKNTIPLRLTSVFEFSNDKWKLVHIHGSKAVETEGDTWHLDEWKQKTEKLEKMVAEQTADLTQKNRELEIEAALERVRAVAMGMHKSEDLLDICEVSYKEFIKLSFTNLRAVLIHILDDEKRTLTDYDYSELLGGKITNLSYDLHKKVIRFLEQIKKSDNAFAEAVFSGDELESWKKVRLETGQKDDPRLNNVDALYYYGYSIGVGDLTISTLKPIDEEQKKILKKFRNVFDLAYRRYNDIALAEAQAREAKIEAALERVRARTMAMHKGNELADTALLLFDQITKFGIKLRGCGFLIMHEESETMEDWSANLDEEGKASIVTGTLAFDQHPIISEVVATWQKGDPYFIGEIHGKDLQKYYKAVTSHESTSKAIKDNVLAKANSEFTNSFYFEYGMMYVLTPGAITEKEIDIMLRFAKVFKQTYTRFLDLQKAEAQAREAQIESALERVRSRSMGMHKSNELKDVVRLLYKEFRILVTDIDSVNIQLNLDSSKDIHFWASVEEDIYPELYHVPQSDLPIFEKIYNAFNSHGERFFDYSLNKEEKDAFFREVFKIQPVPPKRKRIIQNAEGMDMMGWFHKYSGIDIVRYNRRRFGVQEKEIVKRFAAAFEQTYIRFLDLKKAETQAREAEIELALERIRAKTMAMHESEELSEVAALVFEQLTDLGIHHFASGFSIFDKSNQSAQMWLSYEGDISPKPFPIDFNASPVLKRVYNSWQKGKPFYINQTSGEEFIRHIEFLKKVFGNRVNQFISSTKKKFKDAGKEMPNHMVMHHTFFSYGSLLLTNITPIKDQEILNRFAKVFEQTYTRFLDLQKAEAQAREAQIEAALEKVRGRSLAMHSANELGEVVKVIVEKLKDLGVVLDANGIILCTYFKDSKDVLHWIVSPDFSFTGSYLLPYFDHPIFNSAWESKTSGDEYFSKAYTVEEKNSFFEYAFEHSDYKHFPDEFKKWVFQNDKHILSFAWQKNSAILIPSHTGVVPSEEDVAILKRFAKVFEQSYVRFLDLKKAEIQAREAEIQLALERVRARTMAMQKSEELAEVGGELFRQIKNLGINPESSWITFVYPEKNYMEIRVTHGDVLVEPKVVSAEFHENIRKEIDAWKSGEESIQIAVPKNDFMKSVKEVFDMKVRNSPEYALFHVLNVRHKYGFIGIGAWEKVSSEKIIIYQRFAKVFEQTYTRFLDLQKAEAQAREAEIQLALERVRARTMAMHRSDELAETAAILFQQMTELGVTPERLNICLIKEEDNILEVWATDQQGVKISHHFNAGLDEPTTGKRVYDAWKEKKKSIIIDLSGKELNDWIRYVRDEMGMTIKAELVKKHRIHSVAFFSQGMILTTTPEMLPNESLKLLERFADVFNLTYRRFLDLQKAEAQAREAKIESALERVRSRTMGMQNSDELRQLVAVLYNELENLDIEIRQCVISILNDKEKYAEWWSTGFEDKILPKSFIITYDNKYIKEFLTEFKSLIKDNIKYRMRELSGEEKKDFDKTLFEHTDLKNLPEDVKREMMSLEKIYLADAFMKYGMLEVVGPNPISADKSEILQRFAKVFEQTYTRFLDLQKSEAQAREAQIEAALERVRSRTMGMQKSEELKEVIQLVYEQFINLNILIEHTGFILDYKTRDDLHIWLADQREIPSEIIIPCFDSPPNNSIREAKENGQNFFSYLLTFEEKNKFYKDLFKFIPGVPEESLEYYFNCPGLAGSGVLLENIGLYIENFSGTPYSNEENKILMRFGKVFQQTYTRFLDLKKAEEQAKEAEIEAALERVRSRTMGMQKSDELAETAAVVFKQLMNLGIEPNRIYIAVIKDELGNCEFWITDEDGTKVSSAFEANLNKNRYFKKMYEGWKNQKKSAVLDMKGKGLQEYFKYLSELNVPFKGGLSQKRRLQYISYFSQGFIGVASPDETKPETIQLLERFAYVFDLTYTRFTDLKQTEAQNKIIRAENERKTQELEEARELQLAMLPKSIPKLKDFELEVYMQTATEVGGDYYDFSLMHNGSINIAIGDATGHGMKAGTMVTMIKSLFIANSSTEDITEFFSSTNKAIKNSNLKRMMIAFAMVNIYGKNLKVLNAGMPPVYYYKNSNGKILELGGHNFPLGAIHKVKYKADEVEMNQGDVILMLSDGFPELHNEKNELYGYDRFVKTLRKIGNINAKEIIKTLKQEGSSWANNKEPDDDVTFVVIKVK